MKYEDNSGVIMGLIIQWRRRAAPKTGGNCWIPFPKVFINCQPRVWGLLRKTFWRGRPHRRRRVMLATPVEHEEEGGRDAFILPE